MGGWIEYLSSFLGYNDKVENGSRHIIYFVELFLNNRLFFKGFC